MLAWHNYDQPFLSQPMHISMNFLDHDLVRRELNEAASTYEGLSGDIATAMCTR